MSEGKFVTEEQFNNGINAINDVLSNLTVALKTAGDDAKADEAKVSAIKAIQIERDKAIATAKKAHEAKVAELNKEFSATKKELLGQYNPKIEELKATSKEKFLAGTEVVASKVGSVASNPIALGKSILGGLKKGALGK